MLLHIASAAWLPDHIVHSINKDICYYRTEKLHTNLVQNASRQIGVMAKLTLNYNYRKKSKFMRMLIVHRHKKI